jgi:hypothetical protein
MSHVAEPENPMTYAKLLVANALALLDAQPPYVDSVHTDVLVSDTDHVSLNVCLNELMDKAECTRKYTVKFRIDVVSEVVLADHTTIRIEARRVN